MMDAYDPQLAPVRCWEHEDCVDHPELGVVCATGQPTFCQVGRGGVWQEAFWWGSNRLVQQDQRHTYTDYTHTDREAGDGYGDGYCYGHCNGDGSGVSDNTTYTNGGSGRGDNHGYIQV